MESQRNRKPFHPDKVTALEREPIHDEGGGDGGGDGNVLNLLILEVFLVLARGCKTQCLLPFLHSAISNEDFEFAAGGDGGDGNGLNLLILVLTRGCKTRCLLPLYIWSLAMEILSLMM